MYHWYFQRLSATRHWLQFQDNSHHRVLIVNLPQIAAFKGVEGLIFNVLGWGGHGFLGVGVIAGAMACHCQHCFHRSLYNNPNFLDRLGINILYLLHMFCLYFNPNLDNG